MLLWVALRAGLNLSTVDAMPLPGFLSPEALLDAKDSLTRSSNSAKGDNVNIETASSLDPEDPNSAWRFVEKDQVFCEPIEKSASEGQEGCTRFVLMSDTHSKHRWIRPPPGDVLIHAGDFTKMGEPKTILDLNDYFREAQASFQDVVCIAGNHDITLDSDFYIHNWGSFYRSKKEKKPFDHEEIQTYLKDCVYLKDSGTTSSNNKHTIYGSPISPTYGLWAFGMIRGEPIRHLWKKIPSSTDILVTHGPPLGRGDLTFHNGRAGCYDLLQEVQQRVKPRLHVFGHIHEGHGCTFDGQTLFVNAASVDLQYQPTHHCTVVDVPYDPSQPAVVVQPHCALQPEDFVDWLQTRGFEKLVPYAQKADLSQLPTGNGFFLEDAHRDICAVLGLFRDPDARALWQQAASQLYSESFGGFS